MNLCKPGQPGNPCKLENTKHHAQRTNV